MDDADLLNQLRIDSSDRDGGPGRHRRRWPWIVAAVVIVIAALAIWAGLRDQPVGVQIARATAQADRTTPLAVLEATGYVTARREATVSSKITGKLTAVLIEEGDHVHDGQVLARLEDSDQLAQASLARAQIEAAQARRADVETRLAQAQRDYKRQRELRAKKLNSEQMLEDARTNVESLQRQLQAATAQVGVARAQLRTAQVNIEDTRIRAPFDGVVVAKTAQAGEIVSPVSAGGGFTRTGICTLVDMASLEIDVDVNEAYINRVQSGQPTVTVLDAYPGWKIPGHVIAIVPTADRSKATVKVRVSIDSSNSRIVPDMGARVSFLQKSPTETPGAVLVPAPAVVERGGHSAVFVVNSGRAQLRQVRPGRQYEQLRSIDKGISAGDTVIVDPPPSLVNGDRVKPVADTERSGA